MIENIWNNDLQKTIGNTQRQVQSESFFDSLNVKTDNKHDDRLFYQPQDNLFGPSFTNQKLDDGDMNYVIKQLFQFDQPKVLFLSKNSLSDVGLNELLIQLKHNKSLNHLILSHNNLTLNEFSKAALMDLLKINHYIGWLVLNGNDINDEGVANLASALKYNSGVKHIVLADNCITDTGLKVLLNSCMTHPKLESLLLENNFFTNDSLDELIAFCKLNKSIKRLDLRGSTFTDKEKLSILKQICYSKNITIKL